MLMDGKGRVVWDGGFAGTDVVVTGLDSLEHTLTWLQTFTLSTSFMGTHLQKAETGHSHPYFTPPYLLDPPVRCPSLSKTSVRRKERRNLNLNITLNARRHRGHNSLEMERLVTALSQW
ncbi:hypothetical protein Pcinc_033866 [Petrolisthes cinctipes]|uniref:Uncharacterized protein n=1 Tax=Petrolisthes cinctipes TaxID=88211 RepID=A0AAE1JWL8_PETCI|nr:hypothetical protein Pcinc_033866 [Petrolisthes cinctipes]